MSMIVLSADYDDCWDVLFKQEGRIIEKYPDKRPSTEKMALVGKKALESYL